ncbi:hypothetical protein M3Y97_00650900 [Aphelenchoides bicaudatus]|nr:hypothetical protein M3Y97_00650900 [Aphelenchoides bicaudatus]
MAGKNLIVQFNGFPENDLETSDENIIESGKQLHGVGQFSAPRYPMLSKVIEAFLQFERRQTFLSAMHQDKEIVEGDGKMEGCTNRIACMFVMEILSGCNLTREQRISILKTASVQVAMSHKFTLNASRFFPKFGDTRVCSFIGLYYDTQDLSMFFHGLPPNLQNIEIIRPICEGGQKATDKARRLRPTIIESVFLMAVILFEEIERQLIVNESVQAIRDQLYADFTTYQISCYGDPVAAGMRLIRLTSCVYENKSMTVSQEELYNVADIFMPGFRERYYEYLETGQFKYCKTLIFPSEEFMEKITTETGLEL